MDKVELRSCLKTPKICEVNEYSEVRHLHMAVTIVL